MLGFIRNKPTNDGQKILDRKFRLKGDRYRLVRGYYNVPNADAKQPHQHTEYIHILDFGDVQSVVKDILGILNPPSELNDYDKNQKIVHILYEVTFRSWKVLPQELCHMVALRLEDCKNEIKANLSKASRTLKDVHEAKESLSGHMPPQLAQFLEDLTGNTQQMIEMVAHALKETKDKKSWSSTPDHVLKEITPSWMRLRTRDIWKAAIQELEVQNEKSKPPPRESINKKSDTTNSTHVNPSNISNGNSSKNDDSSNTNSSANNTDSSKTIRRNPFDALFNNTHSICKSKGQRLIEKLDILYENGDLWNNNHRETMDDAMARYEEIGDMEQYDEVVLAEFVVKEMTARPVTWDKSHSTIIEQLVLNANLTNKEVSDMNDALLNRIMAQRQKNQLTPNLQSIFEFHETRGRHDGVQKSVRFYNDESDAAFRKRIYDMVHPERGTNFRAVDKALLHNVKEMGNVMNEKQKVSPGAMLSQIAAS